MKYFEICTKPWEELVIHTNGDYSICCGGPPIGRITDIGQIKEIWNNDIVKSYRKQLIEGKVEGICKECVYYKNMHNSEDCIESDYNKKCLDVISDFPKILSLGPTEQCNLKCFMCGYARKYEGQNRIKTASYWPENFLEEVARCYFSTSDLVNTNCFGEIFLYPHFDKLLHLLREYKPKKVVASTAGSLDISEETWYNFMSTHDLLNFSVDSTDACAHSVIRGFDIDKVFQNIEKIKKLKEKHFPNFQYGFSMVLMKINIHNLYDFTKMAVEKWGGNFLNFPHVCDCYSQSLHHEKEWRIIYNDQLRKMKRYLDGKNIDVNGPMGFFYDNNGEIEGERFFNVTEDLDKPKQINAETEFEQNVSSYVFSEYDPIDCGPILYLMDEVKDPVIQLIKKGNLLVISYHKGIDQWVESQKAISIGEGSFVEIRDGEVLLYDVQNSTKYIKISDYVPKEDWQIDSKKIKYVLTKNSKFPDVEPNKTTLVLKDTFKEEIDGPISVGAFYYNWYSKGWEHNCERHNRYGQLSPETGWYESDSDDVIKSHAEQCRKAGIDFLIVSYNGYSDRKKLENLFDKFEKHGIQIAIHYEFTNIFSDPVSFDDYSRTEFYDDIRYIGKSLMSRNNYASINGKKMVYFYVSRSVNGDLNEIVEARKIFSDIGYQVSFFGDEIWWKDKEQIGNINRLSIFDYIYSYNLYVKDGYQGNHHFTGDQYIEFVEGVYQDFKKKCLQINVGLAPCILPRYNDNGIRKTKGHYPIPPNADFYQNYFKMCKKYFVKNPKVLLITSFNEWYEDTQIESCVGDGKGDEYDSNPSYGDLFLRLTKMMKDNIGDY